MTAAKDGIFNMTRNFKNPMKAISAKRKTPRPQVTRTAILAAAEKLLARAGPEELSITELAQLARINRGTVYQHFQTRERLLGAVTSQFSERLRRAVFGDQPAAPDAWRADPQAVAEQMALFAIENPQLARVWLFEVLNSRRPAQDPFLKQYRHQFEQFTNSDLAQPDIDVEVYSVMVLMSTFIWPTFVRAQELSIENRQQIARRFAAELVRLSMYGTLRREKYSDLDVRTSRSVRKADQPKTDPIPGVPTVQ